MPMCKYDRESLQLEPAAVFFNIIYMTADINTRMMMMAPCVTTKTQAVCSHVTWVYIKQK